MPSRIAASASFTDSTHSRLASTQAEADAAKTQQVVAEDVARSGQQLTLTGQRDALESKG